MVAFPSCEFRGLKVMCGPRGLIGEPDHLFHNNGDGTFTDVSAKAGVDDKNSYYGLTAVFADLNNDGKVDVAVGDHQMLDKQHRQRPQVRRRTENQRRRGRLRST